MMLVHPGQLSVIGLFSGVLMRTDCPKHYFSILILRFRPTGFTKNTWIDGKRGHM